MRLSSAYTSLWLMFFQRVSHSSSFFFFSSRRRHTRLQGDWISYVCSSDLAIVLQGVFATVIALSGRYEQILNYVVSVDFISFALTAGALFVFRRRDAAGPREGIHRAPGHPYTTAAFILTCAGIMASTIAAYPGNSAVGLLILLAGIPVYWYWSRRVP